ELLGRTAGVEYDARARPDVLARELNELRAVHGREPHVEQDERGRLFAKRANEAEGALERHDLVARAFERVLHRLAGDLAVIDDDHHRCRRDSRGSCHQVRSTLRTTTVAQEL